MKVLKSCKDCKMEKDRRQRMPPLASSPSASGHSADLPFLNRYTRKDCLMVFAQYLETTQASTSEYKFLKGELHYRWANYVKYFTMRPDFSLDSVVMTNGTDGPAQVEVLDSANGVEVDRRITIED